MSHAICIKEVKRKINNKYKYLPFIKGIEYFYVYNIMIAGENKYQIGEPHDNWYYFSPNEFNKHFKLI